MDTCVRFIIAMNSLNVGLVTCHLARAPVKGSGVPYDFVGEIHNHNTKLM